MKPNDLQLMQIRSRIAAAKSRENTLYAKKFADINPSDIQTTEDFQTLPFTEKMELRDHYPLGIQAVPDEQIVRIHSSSVAMRWRV